MKIAVEHTISKDGTGESVVTVTVTDENGQPPKGQHPEWHQSQAVAGGQRVILNITDDEGEEPDLDDAFIEAAV